MKKILVAFIIICSFESSGQSLLPGQYGDGMKIAFDSKTKRITGWYENYTGYDEKTESPRFSCIFYMEGIVKGKNLVVRTYFPDDPSDLIEGTLEIINDKSIKIKLKEEHGGCWNVSHFADEPLVFNLDESFNWLQIRYIAVPKSYFFKDKITKQKAYIVKKDIVFVEKIENDWALCSFHGAKVTKGWIKLADLNKF